MKSWTGWVLTGLVAACARVPETSDQRGAAGDSAASPIPADVNLAADPAAVLAAARALMTADSNMALVTVDENGQPRIRTVKAFHVQVDTADSRQQMTVWAWTRQSTRKVAQIRRHPQVTLYFNDDAQITYLSIMGSALLYTDPEEPRIKALLDLPGWTEYKTYYWPQFPADFAIMEIRPDWIEFLSPALPGDKQRWTPQAVDLPK